MLSFPNGREALLAGVRLQFRVSGLAPLAIVSCLITPLTYGALVAVAQTQAPASLLVGVALAGIWDVLLIQSIFVVFQERAWRTLDLIVAAPVGLPWPLVGRLLAIAVQGLTAVPVTFVGMWLTVGPPTIDGRVVVALTLGTLFLVGFATVLMAVFVRFRFPPGATNGLFGAVVLASGLFGGAAAIPGWLATIRAPLGATWAMRLVGQGSRPVQTAVIGLVLDLIWLAAGITALVTAERGMSRRPDAFSD